MLYKICVDWLTVLLVRLLVNSRLFSRESRVVDGELTLESSTKKVLGGFSTVWMGLTPQPLYCIWKKRSILIAFSGNCGYSYLVLYQAQQELVSIEVSCIVESETLSVNFYTVSLISIHLSYILNGSFTNTWFCYVVHWFM